MVLHWYCMRINIHESIHVKLRSTVMMKPLRLCIFIHIFKCSLYVYFFNITFDASPVTTFDMFSPPIYDNNYFSFSISFLTRISHAFNHLASISLCFRVISRLLFVLFPIRAIHFLQLLRCHIFY